MAELSNKVEIPKKLASLVAQVVKNLLQCRRPRVQSWVRKIPGRRKWQPTPVFLPGESHGQRSLSGYSPWAPKELDTTKRLTLSLPKKNKNKKTKKPTSQ